MGSLQSTVSAKLGIRLRLCEKASGQALHSREGRLGQVGVQAGGPMGRD
jgi:hypothetical protein